MIPQFAARGLGSLLAAAMLGGCSLAPVYQRPVPVLPAMLGQARAAQEPTAVSAPAEALTAQEQAFVHAFAPDRDLAPLVARALAHAADYRSVALQVQQARAAYRIERAARLPTVGVQAQKLKRHFDDAVLDERYRQDLRVGAIGIDDYELDFFGRLAALSEAARERYLASQAGREAARGALVAEVLRAYTLDCAAAQMQAQTARMDADSAALLAIARRQAEVGLLARDGLDQSQAQADRAHVAALQAAGDARAAGRALQLLAGYDTDPVPGLLAPLATAQSALTRLGELESTVLLQRPDIRQAEAELRAANADIGAARAAFFPSIRLSTSLGSASNGLDGLFEAGSRTWSFVPQLVLPIFDFGRNRANLDLAWTRRQAGAMQYERVIEAAFREVADALDAHATLAESATRLREEDRRAVQRSERAARRTAQGLEDRQDLLADRIDAGRTALDHLQAQRDLALNRIALFHAFYGVVLPTSF